MGREIRVLLVKPLERPRLVTVRHELGDLQELVGGCIAATYPWAEAVGLVCNDNAIAEGLPLNRALSDEEGHVYDVIHGAFFLCGLSGDDFCSISDSLAEKFTELFRYPEMFMRTPEGHVYRIQAGSREAPELLF